MKLSEKIKSMFIKHIRCAGNYTGDFIYHNVYNEALSGIEQLEQQNKELLEALIDDITFLESLKDMILPKSTYFGIEHIIKLRVQRIEKATGKTWEQINE